MDCQEIKNKIPIYLDHELSSEGHRAVDEHLRACPDCRAEAHVIEKSWEMLTEAKKIEPDPYYVTRFWRALEARTPWYEKMLQNVQQTFRSRRWMPALAAAATIVLVSGIVTVQFLQRPEPVAVLAELNAAELEMFAEIDLMEDYDIIRDIEFFSDLEVIQRIDILENLNLLEEDLDLLDTLTEIGDEDEQ